MTKTSNLYVVVVELAELRVHLPIRVFHSTDAACAYVQGRGDRYQIRRMTPDEAKKIVALCDQRLMEHCAQWAIYFDNTDAST